jgi:2-polyprenyl-3-methyl-5-hydroxy-6-metoxy-1,4-benzoquinol methylase
MNVKASAGLKPSAFRGKRPAHRAVLKEITSIMTGQPSANAVDWHDGIAEDFNQGYQRSAGFIEREALWRRLIAAQVKPGAAVLDAGCGSGVFSMIAAEQAGSVLGIDGSAQMIAIAEREAARRGLANIRYETAMLDTLSTHQAASVDAILSSSVLEYVPGYDSVLAEFQRLLRPGGTVIVSMPNAASLYRGVERLAFRLTGKPRYYAHVHNVVSSTRLTAQLATLGLQTVEAVYFANAPVGGSLLSAILPQNRAKSLFVIVAKKAG